MSDSEVKDWLTPDEASARYYEKRYERRQFVPVDRELEREKLKGKIEGLLIEFYQRVESKEDKLSLLKSFAEIEIDNITSSERERRRSRFNRLKQTNIPLTGVFCWVCENKQAFERHHILTINNGGPATLKKNIVCICGDCHSLIHPWMAKTVFESNVGKFAKIVQGIESKLYSRETAEKEILNILDSLFSTT